MNISNDEIRYAATKLGTEFRIFPLAGKEPATKSGFYDATQDLAQIEEWYSGPYAGFNIGIRTGSASKLLVIDVDQKPGGPNGEKSLLELETIVGPLRNTVVQKTGTGYHLLYRYDGADIRCSQSKLGPGLDIKAEGGYIVVAPSLHPDTNTRYTLVDEQELTLDSLAEAPEALLDMIRMLSKGKNIAEPTPSLGHSACVSTSYGEKALYGECQNIRTARCGEQDITLNKSAFAIGQLVQSGALELHHARTALVEAGMAMNNCDLGNPWSSEEVTRKVNASMSDGMKKPRRNVPSAVQEEDIDTAMAEMNEKHAVVVMGGKCLVLNEAKGLNGTTVSFSTFTDLKNRYSARTVKIGRTTQKLGHAWLDNPNRRSYDEVVFDPANRSNSAYNLWKGFAVTPRKGSCSRYLDHIRENIASGDHECYEYILNFMADAVQNPAVRPGVALVLRGGPGTGKGMFVKFFGKLFGRHYVQITDPNSLLGKFNRLLEDKLIVFADEAFWAGDKAAEGRLKGLITEQTITIEMKGIDSYSVENYVRLIIATNEEWAVPAMSKERRFFVLDVSDARQQDRAYFSAIQSEMENGGTEALLHLLLNRNIDGIDIAKFPQTLALEDQKRLSMRPIDQWMMDCLERGNIDYRYTWDTPIPTSVAYDSFDLFCKRSGQKHYMNESTFGKALKTLVPSLNTKKMNYTTYSVGDNLPLNQRVRHYVFSPLDECKKHFERLSGIKLDFSEE